MNKDELSVNCSNGFFFSASDFYKSVFGKKVYKIAIDAGCSCPNRDGTKGTGGCIFCSQKGSGEFSQKTLELFKSLKKDFSIVIISNNSNKSYIDKAVSQVDFPVIGNAKKPFTKVAKAFLKDHNMNIE